MKITGISKTIKSLLVSGFVLALALLAGQLFSGKSEIISTRVALAQVNSCDLWASSSLAVASDANTGTAAAPFKTAQKLITTLQPGQTGCLKGGDSFPATSTEANIIMTTGGGLPGQPVTLRTEPGAPMATLEGTIEIRRNDVTLLGLRLDGKSPSRPGQPLLNASAFIIRGDRITLLGNDITTQSTRICIDVGFQMMEDFGHLATDVVIDSNKIHHCGDDAQPGSGEHGLYLQQSLRARVVNNYVYANKDRGIQVYFESDYAYIANNVVDNNGTNLNIGGRLYEPDGYNSNGLSNRYSDHNLIENNIFSNATLFTRNGIRYNIETYWASDPLFGSGYILESVTKNNLVGNCIYQAPSNTVPYNRAWTTYGDEWSGVMRGDITLANYNYNKMTDPLYQDQAVNDYRLQPNSPCYSKGPLPGLNAVMAGQAQNTSVTLTGEINPHWVPTNFHFEYGLTTGLANRTADLSAGSGGLYQPVSVNLNGLSAGTTYYYRLVAANSFGIQNGPIDSFTTAGVGSCDHLVVTGNGDDGSCGTLRHALATRTGPGNIQFTLATPAVIVLTASLPPLLPGITINVGGVCNPLNPSVTINGNGMPFNALTLSSNNDIRGLQLLNFKAAPLVAKGGGNKLFCLKVNHN